MDILKKVIVDAEGNVRDAQTNAIVAKKEGGAIVPVASENTQTVEQIKQLTSEEHFAQSVNPKEPEKDIKNQAKPQTFCQDKTSYVQEKTKYEVKKDTTFTIDFGLIEKDGRIVVVNVPSQLDNNIAESHWVKFRMWTYPEELKWKNDCMEFNAGARSFILNHDKFNEMKIRNLLLDWSFAVKADKHKLLHVSGYLSDESYEMFKGVFPNVINIIINLMNEVLENNG